MAKQITLTLTRRQVETLIEAAEVASDGASTAKRRREFDGAGDALCCALASATPPPPRKVPT